MAYFPDSTGGPDSMDKVFKLNTQQGVDLTLCVEGVPCQSGASTDPVIPLRLPLTKAFAKPAVDPALPLR